MSQADVFQRDERFSWVADAATVRAARVALLASGGLTVSDYEMRVSTGPSSRTFRGFESFLDAVNSGVDSFSYGVTASEASGATAASGVRIQASELGTTITIYASDEENSAALLNAIRATAPPTILPVCNAIDSGPNDPTRLSISDLHPSVAIAARSLFESGHYFQAEFEAFKSLESRVRELLGSDKFGVGLMGEAFSAENPLIDTATDAGPSGTAQRQGYLALFRGAMLAVRDPKAHIPARELKPRDTMEYLAFASLLHRRLDNARIASRSVPAGQSTPPTGGVSSS